MSNMVVAVMNWQLSVSFTCINTCLSGVCFVFSGLWVCSQWYRVHLWSGSTHKANRCTLGDVVIVRVVIYWRYLQQDFQPWGAHILHQGCTNPCYQDTQVTKCCMVVLSISRWSVQLSLHVMHLAPRILRWFLGYLENLCTTVLQICKIVCLV
jgi:hypothetical protein